MLARKTLSTLVAAALCAIAASGANAAIVNGSFETGPANGAPTGWTDTDSLFTFSRCSVASCGTGLSSAGPSNGSFWIWFGGDARAQTAALSQNALIEATAGFLLFDFWTGRTAGNASLTLSVDSTTLWTVTQADASTYAAGYSTVSVPLGALANGGTHLIRWNYSDAATTGLVTNWSLDNVRLAPRTTSVPEPGSLALVGAAALGLAAVRRRRS